MTTDLIIKPSFKQRMLAAREDAIVQAVNRLLAEKGFEAMTVDEVAAVWNIEKGLALSGERSGGQTGCGRNCSRR